MSVPQILAAIVTCAVLEIALTFRQTRAFVWPASAMLTGSGVALILRVVGTPPDEPWTTYAWYVFAVVAGLSLLPSTSSSTAARTSSTRRTSGWSIAFIVLGSSRVEPLDFWWAPLNVWMLAAYAVIIVGGLLITRRLHLLAPGRVVLADPGRRASGVLAGIGPLHGRELGVRAGLRRRLLARDRDLARGPDLPVLHDHRPQDRARRAASAASCSACWWPSPARC